MKTTRELLDELMASSANKTPVDEEKQYEISNRTVSALSSVVNYIITDAFDLTSEESLWVGHHLAQILAPLKDIAPRAILGAVQKEIESGEYSLRMFERSVRTPLPAASAEFNEAVKYAPVTDWVEGISEIILGSYPDVRPMIRSSIVGSIHGLFTELGVGDNKKNSRPSAYLPTSVRYLLASTD